MKKKNLKTIERFLVFLIIVLIATILTFAVLYSMSPARLQNGLITVYNKYLDVSESLMIKLGINTTPAVKDNIEFYEEEKLTEAQRHYYYQQLSQTGKKIYITIENNIDKLKSGEDNISLPPSLNEDAKSNEDGKDYIAKEFQSAWDAFVTDKSEYFYLDSSKVSLVSKITNKGSDTNYEFYISKGNNTNYFTNDFKNLSKVESAIKEVEKVKSEIINNANGNNYQKIKYVHDWLIDNVKYDTTTGKNSSNIYGCLVNKNVVCEGYARAFKYLMDELEIPCILVSGIAIDDDGNSERHAWNYVYIKNNWYAIDTTWDDPIIIGTGKVDSSIKYKYFLKGSNSINKDHTENGQISKNGFVFKYPKLSYGDIE